MIINSLFYINPSSKGHIQLISSKQLEHTGFHANMLKMKHYGHSTIENQILCYAFPSPPLLKEVIFKFILNEKMKAVILSSLAQVFFI